MTDHQTQMLNVLGEMRDLLRLMAEPAIAQRDKKLREALRGIVRSSTGKKARAIRLMDGTRAQFEIAKEAGIDKGDLSGLVKQLKAADLLADDPKRPQLAISVPSDFFEKGEET